MATQAAQIKFTAAELEKAIEIVYQLLTVSDDTITIKSDLTEIKIPTTALISALEGQVATLESNYLTLENRVSGHDNTIASHDTRIENLENNKLNKTSLATINGQSLSQGGNISIVSPINYVEVE